MVCFREYLASSGLAALPTCTVALSLETGMVHRLLLNFVGDKQVHFCCSQAGKSDVEELYNCKQQFPREMQNIADIVGTLLINFGTDL